EIGHGSDVQSLATTATYDPSGGEDGEWVIHTPFRAAWKDFLGNAAIHAKAATVFARLITKGVDHGVHCFYVPVRDAEGELLPGVSSEDDGPKGGLNGIDNGRLAFDHVRIPRTNLLGRYGDVAADGTYTAPVESPGRRFFTMLRTLVEGRVARTAPRSAPASSRCTSRSPMRRSAASSPPPIPRGRRCSCTTRRTCTDCCRSWPRPTPAPSPTSSCCRPSTTSSPA